MSEGKEVDLDLYNRLMGSLRRNAESLGLHRMAKEITANATFEDYVQEAAQ